MIGESSCDVQLLFFINGLGKGESKNEQYAPVR